MDKGKTYTTVGQVTLGVGVAGLAAGAVLLALQPHKDSKAASPESAAGDVPRRLRVTFTLGATGRGAEAGLVGVF